MKILMVSIPSIHFFRWVDQLKNSNHTVVWFDINGSGIYKRELDWVEQITNWRLRVDFKGRYFVKKNLPVLYRPLRLIVEKSMKKEFQRVIESFKPDLVHSFAMYLSTCPIYESMLLYPKIKWVFSTWGSDLFYYQHEVQSLKDMKKIIPQLDYMFNDCKRDERLAIDLGFKGYPLGVFPGGGGYDFKKIKPYIDSFNNRNILLIKGYEGRSGRCISVLKAVERIKDKLKSYEIHVFGADTEVLSYIQKSKLKTWKNFSYSRKISQIELFKKLGKSYIYIGNSISDGIPNTLLEAICMGVFPIQSDPGNSTSEIIENGKNGLLIQTPIDVDHIVNQISTALTKPEMVKKAIESNNMVLRPKLERGYIKDQVLNKYQLIEERLQTIPSIRTETGNV